ncbi:3-oxoacyl-ACP synthase, partial [Pseudomonas protegens]|nr:3-oxoacyl-ACP synthase [Pseudomonas protegens]
MIKFNIAQWRAWAPGLESVDAWQAWSRQPALPENSDAAPDVSF